MPAWARSIRFRLTLLYSAVLFLLAAVLVVSLYAGLSYSVRDEPVSRSDRIRVVLRDEPAGSGRTFVDVREFERRVNEHTLANLRTFAFGALGALFLASLGVGWIVAGRVLSPIARITAVANEIQARNLARRIELAGPDDELRRLADTFDSMLARLESAFAAQRQFVADVSHELRNPLAIIQSNLEVALADAEGTPEDRREAAQAIGRTLARMARLTDDLLALARLEQPDRVREPVDLAALLREASEEFRAAATVRDLELERPVRSVVVAPGERDLLKRALANLLDNAVRLAPPGSRVRLSAGARDGWVWLAVADEGPGIAPADRERVFGRFWRADETPRLGGGSGLGLAIVRQIAERHAGGVRVFPAAGGGSTFVLWVPAREGTREVPELDPTATL
ncbi:MAG: sensor histidine kinase [Gaiellaceae bacterium]